MIAHRNNARLIVVEMEYARQRSEFVNAFLDLKEKHVEQKDARKIVLEMDSVVKGIVFVMMDLMERIVLIKLV